MPNLNFIRRILYKLKRNYGFELQLYKIVSTANNIESGKQYVSTAKYTIKKAIILTAAELKRQFQYDMSYVAANAKFSYGGFYDTESLYVIVDCRDIPRGFEITLNDFAIHNRKRYSFDKVDLLEHRLAIWIEMRQSKGSVPMELHELNVVSTLTFDQEINNEA